MSTHVQGVLDLTFADIKDEADIDRVLQERLSSQLSPTRKRPEEVKAIRLANNSIENLDAILPPLAKMLDCSKVLWIDLSFNSISQLTDAFLQQFSNMTTIYLQANQFSKLSDIKMFSKVENLKSVALYGNPVEAKKVNWRCRGDVNVTIKYVQHYRNFVLYNCPNVTNFDMSPVTKFERQQVLACCQLLSFWP